MEIAGKSRYRWNTDNNLVSFTSVVCTEDTFDNCCSNLVLNWVLAIRSCGDEELVLYVDEMLTIVDQLDICIRNGVLIESVKPRM